MSLKIVEFDMSYLDFIPARFGFSEGSAYHLVPSGLMSAHMFIHPNLDNIKIRSTRGWVKEKEIEL